MSVKNIMVRKIGEPWLKSDIRQTLWFLVFTIAASAVFGQSQKSVYEKGNCRLELELTIGNEEDDNYIFSGEGSIDVDSKGNIYIFQSSSKHIRKFSSTGEFIRNIGRGGEGPGELYRPGKMVVSSKDEVVVYDRRKLALVIFDSDGKFIMESKLPDRPWKFRVDKNDTAYIETRRWDYSGKGKPSKCELVQLDSNYKKSKVMDKDEIRDNIYLPEKRSNLICPFSPHLLWDILPNGNMVVARSLDYTLCFYDSQGSLLKKVERRGKQFPVTETDKEEFFNSLTYGSAERSNMKVPAWIREMTEFPEGKPFFNSMLLDDRGFILLKTYERKDNLNVWDVFDSKGEFINQVTLPKIGYNSMIKNGALYTWTDEDADVPAVLRYRIQ